MTNAHVKCKHREIRDIYKKLRLKYRRDFAMEFIGRNYFYTPDGIDFIIAKVDKLPVEPDKASIIYQTVMREDFTL